MNNGNGSDETGRFVAALIIMGGGVLLLWNIIKDTSPEANRRRATRKVARRVGEAIGIDWRTAPFSVDQFARGIIVEMEHGGADPRTDVTGDDLLITGKIAWAHLNEFPDYYERLDLMEEQAHEYWGM
jgi:hypothetical protein